MNNTQNMAQNTIVQLNKYPPDKYNVLIPVTSMQVMSNLQKVIVNEVRLNPDPDKGNDVYRDKTTGKLAVTAVGGTKLAAAANISIISSGAEQPEVCRKCVDMAKATGNAPQCGNCPHAYDVKYTVTVRVPEPSGGFRTITKSREIDCALEKQGMTEAQFRRFLPHRASIAETKAYMRCIRAALGLAQGYTPQEIARPFVIAHIVPNLDAPDIRKALINNSLKDMGLLFETPTGAQAAIEQAQPLALAENSGYTEKDFNGGNEPEEEYPEAEYPDGEEDGLPWDALPDHPQPPTCADCGREITEAKGRNGQTWTVEAIKAFSEKKFGRCLCAECQKKAANGGRR